MNLASKRRVRDWHSALGVALSGFSTSLDVIDAGVEGTGISCNGMPNPSFVELLLTLRSGLADGSADSIANSGPRSVCSIIVLETLSKTCPSSYTCSCYSGLDPKLAFTMCNPRQG
jgi:hypothetical protein